MKLRMTAALLIAAVLLCAIPVCGAEEPVTTEASALPFEVNCRSAVLMDASTGTVLYDYNGEEALPPASVTKVMTLLIIIEEIDAGNMKLTDQVQASETASHMGGSQIFLKVGESMTVEDLLKSVVIASANDAAVALAEAVDGSVDSFVAHMNQRAAELGLTATHFENVTGLDDQVTDHVFSAKDIAVTSRELLKHPAILQYTGIWMDTVRNGAFGLTNTNRMIRFYAGATGLKTGFTSKAMYCISATAKKGDLHLIAVVMGAATRDERNAIAKKLLDWGFANYELYVDEGSTEGPVAVKNGTADTVTGRYGSFTALVKKGESAKITKTVTTEPSVNAPIVNNQALGRVEYLIGERKIGEQNVTAAEEIPKIGFFGIFWRLLSNFLLK